MFSRVLKPVATVAVQNGKNFSTTSQVCLTTVPVIHNFPESTKTSLVITLVNKLEKFHVKYTYLQCFVLEQLQSRGCGRLRWYRPASGPSPEAEPSGNPPGPLRSRAGDPRSRCRPVSHGHSSPGLSAQRP